MNFFDKDKTRIGFIKWSLNPGKIQIYDCSNAEELSWDKTPPTRFIFFLINLFLSLDRLIER